MNALSLAAAARMGGGRVRPFGLLAGAAAGAGIAVLARRFALGRMRVVCLWLPAALVMMTICCGRSALRRPLRNAGLLLCAYGLLGGTVLALHGATGSLPIAYALGAVGMTVMTACALRARRAAMDVRSARMLCCFHGRTAAFEAMMDSGNTLRDYLTHLPVIVIAEKSARCAFDLEKTPLRPIFAQTAGGRLMMGVFTPQKIVLEAQGRRQNVRAVVALSPAIGADSPALVPASLLEGRHEQT